MINIFSLKLKQDYVLVNKTNKYFFKMSCLHRCIFYGIKYDCVIQKWKPLFILACYQYWNKIFLYKTTLVFIFLILELKTISYNLQVIMIYYLVRYYFVIPIHNIFRFIFKFYI